MMIALPVYEKELTEEDGSIDEKGVVEEQGDGGEEQGVLPQSSTGMKIKENDATSCPE